MKMSFGGCGVMAAWRLRPEARQPRDRRNLTREEAAAIAEAAILRGRFPAGRCETPESPLNKVTCQAR